MKDLKAWFTRSKRKPLILRGARQVGKSTLVRLLAKELGLDLLEVNLERLPLKTLQNEGFPIELILQEIEVVCNKRISANSLIFIDEIQAQEKMIRALRYFYEERPDLPVIAAGSLLDLFLGELEQVPVGRIEYYHLGPMQFTEFLEALGEEVLLEYVRNPKESFMEAVHAKCIIRYKEFLFVGGMPEAVATYVNTKSPLEVRRIQEAIIETYRDDFAKYAKHSQIHRLRKVFDYIPGHIGEKVKYSEISGEERSRDLKIALDLLVKARVIIPVFHANATMIPLRSYRDENTFKLYFLDVGLANALQRVPWTEITDIFSKDFIFKGAIAEQFVAQHLYYSTNGSMEPELFYWLREKKKQNAEIDFIYPIENLLVPIEVKAESAGHMRSLLVFMSEKKWVLAVKLSLEPLGSELVEKGIKGAPEPAVFELRTVPLYLVEGLSKLLN